MRPTVINCSCYNPEDGKCFTSTEFGVELHRMQFVRVSLFRATERLVAA